MLQKERKVFRTVVVCVTGLIVFIQPVRQIFEDTLLGVSSHSKKKKKKKRKEIDIKI